MRTAVPGPNLDYLGDRERSLEWVVRPATSEDCIDVAELAARTFFETYCRTNSVLDLASYVSDRFTPLRIACEIESPASNYFIASPVGATEPVAYAKLRRSHGPATSVGTIELQRLYVARSFMRMGVGQLLLLRCVDEVIASGFRSVWLGVDKDNARAQEFYRRNGFETVGTKKFRLGRSTQLDLVMERDLFQSRTMVDSGSCVMVEAGRTRSV